MRLIVIGGDDRMVRLCRLLEKDGHSVFPLALEKALPVQGPPDWAGAEAIILPLPWERNGTLNAPLSGEKHGIETLLAPARPGTRVCAGRVDDRLRQLCAGLGLPLADYFERETLTVRNAALTAEGALRLMLERSALSLAGRRVLICGFGRIGKLLSLRLRGMGVRVDVAARSAADRAWAEALDCQAMDLNALSPGNWDFVVNTIPCPVLGERELRAFGKATLIELASPPYGFQTEAAETLEKDIILASGLPGWAAPESAAAAVRDSIYQILEE